MAEKLNMSKVVDEIKNANEEELRKLIESWFNKTRTDGMRLGAKMIAAGVLSAIQKNLDKKAKLSLRDYERCIKDIRKIISIQLTKQDDSETNEVTEETVDDGTAE